MSFLHTGLYKTRVRNARQPVITLLTDFGTTDHYVGAMKGVILGICPQILMVDISHEVTPFGIAEGAYTLAQAWYCFPKGTVHLVVVDPGVGSNRRPILASVDGHKFIAPDNGVLGMVLAKAKNAAVREITTESYFRQPVSGTFHGRDVFAPVAAHVARGVPETRFGKPVADYFRPAFAMPKRTARRVWAGTVLKIDRFGNVITNLESGAFPLDDGAFSLQLGMQTVSRFTTTYAAASPGIPLVIPGSSGYLEVSLKEASAARELGVNAGSPIELKF